MNGSVLFLMGTILKKPFTPTMARTNRPICFTFLNTWNTQSTVFLNIFELSIICQVFALHAKRVTMACVPKARNANDVSMRYILEHCFAHWTDYVTYVFFGGSIMDIATTSVTLQIQVWSLRCCGMSWKTSPRWRKCYIAWPLPAFWCGSAKVVNTKLEETSSLSHKMFHVCIWFSLDYLKNLTSYLSENWRWEILHLTKIFGCENKRYTTSLSFFKSTTHFMCKFKFCLLLKLISLMMVTSLIGFPMLSLVKRTKKLTLCLRIMDLPLKSAKNNHLNPRRLCKNKQLLFLLLYQGLQNWTLFGQKCVLVVIL